MLISRSHVRRLEALRRASIVERIDADHWCIPDDFEQRAAGYDVRVASTLQSGSHAVVGFWSGASSAMEKRKQALVDMGYATDLGGGPCNLCLGYSRSPPMRFEHLRNTALVVTFVSPAILPFVLHMVGVGILMFLEFRLRFVDALDERAGPPRPIDHGRIQGPRWRPSNRSTDRQSRSSPANSERR